MYTHGFSDFDRIVFMLLDELPSIPAEELAGIVRHYLRSSTPASGHVDLLLVAVALPEFDDAQFEAVRAARADVPLQVRGARLAGLAARPDADPRALLRGERSLKARLYAAELTRSPQLLAELVVKAPPKLIIAALANPWRSEEVDLAAIDIIEEPHRAFGPLLSGGCTDEPVGRTVVPSTLPATGPAIPFALLGSGLLASGAAAAPTKNVTDSPMTDRWIASVEVEVEVGEQVGVEHGLADDSQPTARGGAASR